MAHSNPLDILTPVEKRALADTYLQKLKQERVKEADLQRQLAELRSTISRWRQFIDYLSSQEEEGAGDGLSYSKSWTRVDKVFYAARNPQIIGKESLAGAHDFLKLLLKLEPGLLGGEAYDVAAQRYSSLLSNLSWKRRMAKLREKQNKQAVHYFDLSWFDGGVLKPEHQHLLETLEYIPVTPKAHGEGGNDESEDMSDSEEEAETKTAPADTGAE